MKALVWEDYERFCRESSSSYLALIQYWYHHEPHAQSWWENARRTLEQNIPLKLDDKTAFTLVASGIHYYFDKSYVFEPPAGSPSGQTPDIALARAMEGPNWDSRWARHRLSAVEVGFMDDASDNASPTQAAVPISDWLSPTQRPVWQVIPKRSLTLLPVPRSRFLYPIYRFDFSLMPDLPDSAYAKRLLGFPYNLILEAIDGRRSIEEIRRWILHQSDIPADALLERMTSILKDLSSIQALRFDVGVPGDNGKIVAVEPDCWRSFRSGEFLLLQKGDPLAAERCLLKAVNGGLHSPWLYGLLGEALRHLGKTDKARIMLDKAIQINNDLVDPFEVKIRSWSPFLNYLDQITCRKLLEDRLRLFRAKVHMANADWKGVLEDAEAALKANPRNSEAFILRAKAASHLGLLKMAQEDLKTARDIARFGDFASLEKKSP